MFKKAGIILFCLAFAGLAIGTEPSKAPASSKNPVSSAKSSRTAGNLPEQQKELTPEQKEEFIRSAYYPALKKNNPLTPEQIEELYNSLPTQIKALSLEQIKEMIAIQELEVKSRGLCPHCADNSANLEREEVTNPNEVSAIVDAGESSSPSKKAKSSKGLQ